MRTKQVSCVYCVEMTIKQMQKLLKRDERAAKLAPRTHGPLHDGIRSISLQGSLYDTLSKLGARAIEYDGMFGPYVWFTLDTPFEPSSLEEIQKTISHYVR